MRKLLISMVMAAWAMSMSAIPAKRGIWRTVTLQDGSLLKVELRGNEYMHFWQSEDGRCFVLDSKGAYVQKEREDLLQQAAQNRAKIKGESGPLHSHVASTADGLGEYGKSGMGSVKSIGEVNIPVILVEFDDMQYKEGNTNEKMDRYFNEEGYHDEAGCVGSAHDYFVSQSYGMFVPHFPVVAKVRLSKGYAEYGANDDDGNDKNVMAMVREAIGLAVDQGVDFSQYYVNKSVPLVSLIYAGLGEASGGDENTIWPHQLDLSSWNSTISGYSFKSYFVGNELSYNGGLDGIGTFCHEFGHGLGLPDFYCTNYSYEGESPFGNWSIMDSGSMINNGRAPIGYLAYERSYLGWLTIPEVTSPQGVILGDPEEEGSVPAVLFRKPNDEKEYFIFENKQPGTWFPKDLGSGLLVSRIAYSRDKWMSNTINNNKDAKRAMAVPADGSKLYYTAASSNLYGYSVLNVPSWTYFNKTECTDAPIYKVMRHDDRTVSFNIMGNDLAYTYKPTVGTTYTRVDDASLLAVGDTIIFVNVDDAVAMGSAQTPEARLGVCANIIDDNSVLVENNAQEIVLRQTATGLWVFQVGSSYLTTTGTGSKLISTDKPTANATATISIADGVADIAFQIKNSNHNIRYNVEGTYFACFDTEGSPIRIYRKNTANAIQTIEASPVTSRTGAFSITGQREDRNRLGKGIHIVDGKKVLVR